jgi:hypothetical protein
MLRKIGLKKYRAATALHFAVGNNSARMTGYADITDWDSIQPGDRFFAINVRGAASSKLASALKSWSWGRK